MSGPTRREVLAAGAGLLMPAAASGQVRDRASLDAERALAALEQTAGGRLGAAVLDAGSGRLVGHRLDERFAMCSTFKLPLAALVLRHAERGGLRLDEVVPITQADVLSYAPVTTPMVGRGLTIAALAEAAQVTSDNTAANLLLARLGGPAAFTAALRALGDTVTRLDRTEPTLNLVTAGDLRDTTSPRAMATTLARLLTGDTLGAASRERLVGWMVATRTGSRRIRAGLPAAWRAGDKTGTAQAPQMTDKVNDVAMAWPPGRSALVVTAYFDSNRRSTDVRDEDQATLAEVGRIAAAWATA